MAAAAATVHLEVDEDKEDIMYGVAGGYDRMVGG